jgi:hypothetical protein
VLLAQPAINMLKFRPMSVLDIYNADNTNNLSSKNKNIVHSNTVNVSDKNNNTFKNDNTFKLADSTYSA